MLRNIIWDVDGTLFDTYPPIARAIRAALNDLGHDAPLEWIEELAKESLGHCGAVLAARYHLAPQALDRAADEHLSRITAEESPPFPGVIELCRYICSIGGKNAIVTHRGRQSTTRLLTAHEMAGYFCGCIARDDGHPRKPHPAAFQAALAAYGLKPEETLTVGDRGIDILAGQAVGVFTCFYGLEPDGVEADLVIGSFDELRRFLAKGGPSNG